MNKTNETSPPAPGRGTPRTWAWFLGTYLVVLMVVALVVIGCYRPGKHRCSQPGQSEKHKFFVDATAKSLVSLRQAQTAIAAWQIQGATVLSTADKTNIQSALDLAAWLVSDETTNTTVTTATNQVTQVRLLTNSFSLANTTGPGGMTTALKLNQQQSNSAAASSYFLTNSTGKNGSVTAVTLDQRASITVTKNTDSSTKYQTSPEQAVIPMTGNLRLIPARNLALAYASLGEAIKALQSRALYLETNEFTRAWPSKFRRHCFFGMEFKDEMAARPVGIPLLTPGENYAFQSSTNCCGQSSLASDKDAPSSDLLILLFALGVFGGTIKCLASLVEFLGQQKFLVRWKAYYLLHPLIGGGLAIAFVLVLKGGLSTDTAPGATDPTNPYGLYAIALVVGMFSDEATKKLAKIAQAIFTDNKSADSADSNDPSVQHVTVEGSPAYGVDNISSLDSLVKKLMAPPVPPPAEAVTPDRLTIPDIKVLTDLSQYLFQQLSSATVKLLKAYVSSPDPQLQQALVDDLNKIINNQPLYQAPFFSSNIKSSATAGLYKQLMGLTPKPSSGPDMQKLNRLLLAGAYPNEIISWVITLLGTNLSQKITVLIDGKLLPAGVKPVIVNATTMTLALSLSDYDPGDHSLMVSNTYPIGCTASIIKLTLP